MTEEEKELEERTKQYQYELEENQKKMEEMQNDLNKKYKKGKKKSFAYKLSHTFGAFGFAYCALVVIFVINLIYIGLNFYIDRLNTFNPIKITEENYQMGFKQLSRQAGDKVITFKAKPKKWKYRKVEFTIVRKGGATFDDFGDRYLKYIIEHLENKEVLKDFDVQEEYDENGLLKYNIKYTKSENADAKIQELKNEILKYDKKAEKIIKQLDKNICKQISQKTFFLGNFMLKYKCCKI